MNAERLHAIANAIYDEMSSDDIVGVVAGLRDNLRQSVNEPNQPGPQQQVSALRTELGAKLSQASSNGFSPAWREALGELGIADLVGEQLRERIESVFEGNELTPASAVDQLDPIVERVQQLYSALENVRNGLSFLGVGAEELGPGQVEIGFLIPRGAVGELEALGMEFVELKKILGPFLEISTGHREELCVRSISSSAFGAFLDSAPAVALIVASTVERLIAAYKNVLEIRLAHQKLKESGTSDKALKTVAEDAEAKMGRDIQALVNELLKQALPEIDKGRKNELRKELTVSLNALANRIDRGYSIEVRAGEIEPPADEEDEKMMSAEERAKREIIEKVLEKQESLKFANVTGQPILTLPESTADASSSRSGGGSSRRRVSSRPSVPSD